MKYLLIFILSMNLFAQEDQKLFQLSFGPVQLGESRIPIDLNDFAIINKTPSHFKSSIRFINNSVQWVRMSNNLLTPRARIEVSFESERNDLHLVYAGKSILLSKNNNHLYTELYISLFNPAEIEVIENGKKVGKILVHANSPRNKTETKLIDYSCANYGLQIKGIEGEYISVGCRMERLGSWGNERPRLEVSWSATNYTLLDRSPAPYVSIFTKNDPVVVAVADDDGNKKEITITAEIPEKMHRLKTAFGIGPYSFATTQSTKKRDPVIAPSFMLYGNLYLSPGASVRMFDALVWQDSIFNNVGFYFAYDIAQVFDQRIIIVPLLGLQGLTFKYNKAEPSYTRLIYPQGGEIVYNHAFGIPGYSVIYGMFLSPSSEVDYTNIWLRWGRKIFWELNYIDWADTGREASMYGLSIGLPIGSYF